MTALTLRASSAITDLLTDLVAQEENFRYVAREGGEQEDSVAAVIITDEHRFTVYGTGHLEKDRLTGADLYWDDSEASDRYAQTGE